MTELNTIISDVNTLHQKMLKEGLKKEQRNKKDMGHMENRKQNVRHKFNHINNTIKCKWIR